MNKNYKDQPAFSAEGTKYSLHRLQAYFNEQARVMRSALELIESLEKTVAEKDREIVRLKAASLTNGKTKSFGNGSVTFLIDGSGSMAGAPLKAALDSAALFQSRQKETPLYVALFGNKSAPHYLSPASMSARSTALGLNCSTDLTPALENFKPIGTKEHLVIITDGTLSDEDKCKDMVERLLKQNKNLTVDFIILSTETIGGASVRRLQEAVTAPSASRQIGVLQVRSLDSTAIVECAEALLSAHQTHKSTPRKKPAGPKAA